MFTKTAKVFVCLVSLLFSTQIFAAKVIQSKNGKVIVDLEGQDAVVNQNIILVNAQNKRVAIGKITLVKNGKAIATITKGKAQGNEKVTFAGKPKTTGDGPVTQTQETPIYTASSKKISVLATMMSNSMTTRQIDGGGNTDDVAMKGSTFGVTAAVDWPVMPSLSLRATLGYEPFKADGDSKYLSCNGQLSVKCTAEITYLSGGGYVRWDITQPKTQFWIGGGAALKFPMSKTTTALKPDDIKMTVTYAAALGVDFFIATKTFIPVSLEYQMFLKSDTVSANIMMVRGGYGMTF